MNIAVNTENLNNSNSENYLDNLSNEDYVAIVEAKTKINSKILNILNNENLSKEHKSLLVEMLTSNANQSSMLLKIMRDNILEDVDLNKIFEPKNNSNKFLDKFKNMIVGFQSDFSPNVFFKNQNLANWKEVGRILTLKIKPEFSNKDLIKNLVNFLSSKIDETKVFVKQKNQNIYLIGQKYKIKKLYNQHKEIFSLLSVNTNDFLSSKNKELHNEEQVVLDINNHLLKKLGMSFNKQNNHYSFNLLNNLNDTLKFEMISTIIAPEIFKQLNSNYQVKIAIEKQRENNKYISMVNQFALNYNLNPLLVMHSIKEGSQILNSYPGFEKLDKNKENILIAESDYELLLKKNLTYINELLVAKNSLIHSLNHVNIEKEKKHEFFNNFQNKSLSHEQNQISINDFEIQIKQLVSEKNIVSISNQSEKNSKQLKLDFKN